MPRRRAAPLALALALVACGLDVVGLPQDAPGLDDAGAPNGSPSDGGSPDAPRPSDAGLADAVVDLPSCPEAWIERFGRCYRVLEGTHSQPQSKVLCADAGAGLVTVRNVSEQELLGEAGAGIDVWLGLESPPNPQNDAAAYRWLSGDPSTYRGWKEQEPDDNSPCARILPTPPYGWADKACDTPFVAICERDR